MTAWRTFPGLSRLSLPVDYTALARSPTLQVPRAASCSADREPSRFAAAPATPGFSGISSILACSCVLRTGTVRVRLARRADIPVRSNVFCGSRQQIRAKFAFGRGCGQECQSLSILPELEWGMVGAGVI